MTDVPPGNDGPGNDPEPYEPSGTRRATFTPPEPGAAPPAFDDDALADAMAAEVAAYTSPIAVTPAAREPEAPVPPEPKAASSSTLEAIERLEDELRRRANTASGLVDITPESPAPQPPAVAPTGVEHPFPDSPIFPPPPTFLRSAPPPDVDVPGFTPPPASSEPLEPPFWALPPPPNFAPPTLVEPPPPNTGSIPVFAPHPATPAFGIPPVTPPIDLPPPGTVGAVDFAQLPPPIGLVPAAIPPYDPSTGPALLNGAPAPHPDDLDDVVDEVDRVFGTATIAVDPTGSVLVVHPPSEPIPTARLAEDDVALADDQVENHPALVVESAGLEPTALDLRAGRAARLFWLWFAANSSVVSLSLGAVIFGLGMSLRQSLIAIVIGVALSFLPLGLGTLAGKWSGQPMMVVSRAAFGLVGNAVPAVLSVSSRVFWGAALLWLLASGVAQVLVDSGLDAGLGHGAWTLVGLGGGFLFAFVVAIFGYGLIARLQLVLSILTGLLVAGVIAITFPRLDLQAAQLADDGPWILVVTGVVLVFSFVGLAWVHSSADVARYQRTDGDGGSTMLWATFGATLPAFLLIAWGAMLAASDPLIAEGLAINPLHTIAALLPIWYPAPLLGALALGLLSGIVLTIYSGGFALQSLGIRTRRSVTTAIAGILVLIVAGALLFIVGDARDLIRDVVTTIAVPVAAWAGIFGAEMIIRSRFSNAFDSAALLKRGGIYPAVRWVNLIGLLAITALGFGLTSAVLPGLDWQGYLFPVLGLDSADPLLTSDIGVLVALVLGILLPLLTAVPTIRRQERALGDERGAP